MKRLYLYALTSLLVTSSVATGVTILGGSHNKNSTSTPSNNTSTSLAPSNEPYVDTPQVKFMNNILQAGNIDLDALFNIKYKESNIDLGFKGTVSYYDLSNIKAGGTLNVKYDSLDYNIDFTYIDSTLYASTTFINAKIDIPTFSEGIKAIIPLFSNKVEVPEDSELNKVLDINVDGLLGSLSSLTFVPSDEYAYKAEFALNDYISFNIYTDENYKTKKLELNEVKVNDVDIQYIPDGFNIEYQDDAVNSKQFIYFNEEGNELVVDIMQNNVGAIMVDNENQTYEELIINDRNVHFFYDNEENYGIGIVGNNKCVVSVQGHLPREELLKIFENIK